MTPGLNIQEKLENFITTRFIKAQDYIETKTATSEDMRLMDTDAFIAELESIPIEGFTIVKREINGRPSYTITCDAHSDCFIDIWMKQSDKLKDNGKYKFFCCAWISGIQSDTILLSDLGGSVVIRFLQEIENTIKEFDKRKKKFEDMERDKEFWQNQIDAEITRVCNEIKRPYHIIKQSFSSALYILLEDNSCLNIAIPHKNAMEMLPELSNIIQKYIYLQKTSKAKVLIYRCSDYTDWEWKENNTYEAE